MFALLTALLLFSAAAQAGPLKARLALPKSSYKHGEEILAAFRLENTGSKPLHLRAPMLAGRDPARPTTLLVVLTAGDGALLRRRTGVFPKAIPAAPTSITLAPGGRQDIGIVITGRRRAGPTYDREDASGRRTPVGTTLPPGRYRLKIVYRYKPGTEAAADWAGEVQSNEADFSVVGDIPARRLK